ncbi:uncharacterized protein LOC131434256 [Malaya genurostris]|uniref:uncharacterized protein LOC131434256 n=1 Tax=Malaya genurostris TaxID=325434 RepID=UPI0026F3C167|nr:uncharacterized protein LOC131434256 [Malaya genurostris]
MSQPHMAADWHADYSDNLVLHDISVKSSTSADGDGINDNGVSSSFITTTATYDDATGDDLGGDGTTSLFHAYSTSAQGVGPIVSNVLFISTTTTASPTYSSSALLHSQSLPMSSTSGMLELNEQPAYHNDDNPDNNDVDDEDEYEQNFQSTMSTSSSDYDSQSDEHDDADDGIFTANDNDTTYVTTTSKDPDLITNNSFDVELSTVDSDAFSTDNILPDDDTKLRFVEEERLPNDDPLAHYEHLVGAAMDDVVDVELISLEDGPISGEEMRKTRNKLYYKNVQEKQSHDREHVEIHTLPSPVEKKSQIVSVPVTPQAPIYLVHEAAGTSEGQTEGPTLPRLLVNISIATDNGTGTVQHSVYVLQVSIPTPSEYIPKAKQSEFEQESDDSNRSCPLEPPPAPPCPIKCPNSSLFEKYQIMNVIDESESVEEAEDNLEEQDLGTNEFNTTILPTEKKSTGTTDVTEEVTDSTIPPMWECPKIIPAPILILEGELM